MSRRTEITLLIAAGLGWLVSWAVGGVPVWVIALLILAGIVCAVAARCPRR